MMYTAVYGMNLVLIWTCVLLNVRYGATTKLPDDIEDINTDSYACYGCNEHWQPSCDHKPNTVIGVQAIKIGAKPRDLNCSDVITSNHSDECKNETCCLPYFINDCIGVYDYPEFHRSCSGKPKCTNTVEIVRDMNVCDDHSVNDVSTYTYQEYTNYFYMEYACIEESDMIDMCRNGTYYSDNATLYLHTPQYPNNMMLTMSTNCTCVLSAEADLKLDAYLIDVQLNNIIFTLDDGRNGLFQYDVTSATYYNITKNKVWNGAFISLENLTDTYSGTKIWLGIKAQTGGPFNITCRGPSTGESSTPSTLSFQPLSMPSTTSAFYTPSSPTSSFPSSSSSSTLSTSSIPNPSSPSFTSSIPSTVDSSTPSTHSIPSSSISSFTYPNPPTISTPYIPSVAPVKENNTGGGVPVGVVVGAVIGLLLLLLLLLCCCFYRCFKRKKRQKEKQQQDGETNADNDAEAGELENGILVDSESKLTMNNNFITPLPLNKVAPTPFIEEHGGLGLYVPALPPIAAVAPAATILLPNGGHRHLKPIQVSSQQEKNADPPGKKKKKKKRRKRNNKHTQSDTPEKNVENDTNKKSDTHRLNNDETDA